MVPSFFQYVLGILFIGSSSLLCSAFTAKFEPEVLTVNMHGTATVNLILEGLPQLPAGSYLNITSVDDRFVEVSKQIQSSEIVYGRWSGSFELAGVFYGKTSVYVELFRMNFLTERADDRLLLTVIRPKHQPIESVFNRCVAVLVCLLYINFGAALNLKKMKGIIKKPIGPIIGFCGQFIVMPLLGFSIGYLLFPNNLNMRLGLFFTGCSPVGAASNIWTAILGGNVDLSITLTSISTFAAFGMMPLWIFIGKVVFDNASLEVPYRDLATYVAALIVPLTIGLLIQRYLPRTRNILVRILKPASILLTLFIVMLAIVTNVYLFELFSWQIILAGMALPWLGYIVAYVVAGLLGQSHEDRLAIGLETGIQNTVIAIFLLHVALPQPSADVTAAVPASVAIMTPIPLLVYYIVLNHSSLFF